MVVYIVVYHIEKVRGIVEAMGASECIVKYL
jgi:hypothetical protein